MCLIFTNRPTDEALSDAWLTNFYTRNQDGWGFMWFDTISGTVQVHKALGTCAQWIADFRLMESFGVEFATHLRMRTHGATDLVNVHPYPVIENFEIMHNGILASGYGTGGDQTKSDTWHYIVDTLRPLIAIIGVDAATAEPVLDLIGESIGNNRFVMITPSGDMKFVNAHQGKAWHGRWMSNCYAWSADLKQLPSEGPVPKPIYTPYAGRKSGWSMANGGVDMYDMYEDYEGFGAYTKYGTGANVSHLVTAKVGLDDEPFKDLEDIEAEEAEAALALAVVNIDEPQPWVDTLDEVEELFDFPTAMTIDLINQEMESAYTRLELAEVDIPWLRLAQWAFESDANKLAEMIAGMREGYALDTVIEAALLTMEDTVG